jgi:SnoaL-like domain
MIRSVDRAFYASMSVVRIREPTMPSLQTLERFIARVEDNKHIEALQEFYASDATMQENQSAPRVGLTAHIANEERVLPRARSLTSTCVRPFLVHGDTVAIRWIFEFEWLDGTRTRMEEIAWQRWEGDRVVEETFFYDPAQRVPRK